MNINFTIPASWVRKAKVIALNCIEIESVIAIATILALAATTVAFMNDWIVAYGDAESHLNIAKRVVHSITPGLAQLGGIWLPIPHAMLVPFVYFDSLWRTGLAGSIVSGISFIVSTIFLYKTTQLLTRSKLVAFVASIVFATNPNILYLQATPMTELVLIMFFILSTYYFLLYLTDTDNVYHLIIASFFTFCATLSRYDGWFLVLFQVAAIGVLYLKNIKRKEWRKKFEGQLILFATLGFFGVGLWFLWDFMILGDPFYFTNSQFSAKSQQQEWYARGELPAYHNMLWSFAYYMVTSMSNAGFLIFIASLFGFFAYLKRHFTLTHISILLILLVPFIFNVTTMFMGQSVIFIPHLTPTTFEWTLFNVRYGAMMVPAVSIFFAYLFVTKDTMTKLLLTGIFIAQMGLFVIGYSPVISLADGTYGLSRAKRPAVEQWMRENYDGGLVLIDDFARTLSIVRSDIPMQNIIYIGNRKYWDESFYAPEKYATWIIMQQDDQVWTDIYEKPHMQGRLFKHFQKVYTSPTILIFKRNDAF